MNVYKKEETALFYTGWAIVFLSGILFLAYRFAPLPLDKLAIPCILHHITGLYCPGCGGTRAIYALLHGRFLVSFVCHPLVPYTAACGGWFLISQSIERISRRRIRIGMHFHDFYIWAGFGIAAVNFIVKNVLLLAFQVDLLDSCRICIDTFNILT